MKSEHVDRSAIEELERRAVRAFSEAASLKELESERVHYLGRKGEVTEILRSIGSLPAERRPVIGIYINELKQKLENILEEKRAILSAGVGDEQPYPGDPTLPGRSAFHGGLHILHRVLREIKEIFFGMGYSLTEGPDVELDYYNFEALNFPPDHPSRDLQDTFYINRDILLRTQTSPVQVRYMEKHKPPMRIIVPGRVYRNETPDPSHAAEFLQMEGLYVDTNVSLAEDSVLTSSRSRSRAQRLTCPALHAGVKGARSAVRAAGSRSWDREWCIPTFSDMRGTIPMNTRALRLAWE